MATLLTKLLVTAAAAGMAKLWMDRRRSARESSQGQEEKSKAIVLYRGGKQIEEEIGELPTRPTGWIITYTTPHQDTVEIYRLAGNLVLNVKGEAVAIVATKNYEEFAVEHDSVLWVHEGRGCRIALTTFSTLQVVSPGEIAYELGQGGHEDEDVENYIMDAIHARSGHWVALAIVCFD